MSRVQTWWSGLSRRKQRLLAAVLVLDLVGITWFATQGAYATAAVVAIGVIGGGFFAVIGGTQSERDGRPN